MKVPLKLYEGKPMTNIVINYLWTLSNSLRQGITIKSADGNWDDLVMPISTNATAATSTMCHWVLYMYSSAAAATSAIQYLSMLAQALQLLPSYKCYYLHVATSATTSAWSPRFALYTYTWRQKRKALVGHHTEQSRAGCNIPTRRLLPYLLLCVKWSAVCSQIMQGFEQTS